eukprot:521172_1
MGQTLSQHAPSTCCGAESTYDGVLKTESAFEYRKDKNEPIDNEQQIEQKLSDTQYEEFVKERHKYELQIIQFQQQLLQKDEALNKYKAIQQKRIDEENTIDEYKQHNIYQSKENEASDGNTIWHKYDELLEECNQYKHENTKLKRTKDELQRKLSQLTKIVDDIEAKSPQPTAPIADPNDMLQHIMLTLSETQEETEPRKQSLVNGLISPLPNLTDTDTSAKHSLRVIMSDDANPMTATLHGKANSNPSPLMVKRIMLSRYKTDRQILLTETPDTSWQNASDDESTSSHLETDEEMEIAQAKEAEIKKKEEDNEIMAMQKEMDQLKRSSNASLHRVKSLRSNKSVSVISHDSVFENESDSASDELQQDGHLFRSGTERQWDRHEVIQQKKEMEDAMAALVESALTQFHKQ